MRSCYAALVWVAVTAAGLVGCKDLGGAAARRSQSQENAETQAEASGTESEARRNGKGTPQKQKGTPTVELPVVPATREAPLPSDRPFLGDPGVDSFGYPTQDVDRLALRAWLRGREFARLTEFIDSLQAEFEKDYAKEYWVTDAVRSFSVADPTLEPLLDEWVRRYPDSYVAYGARAAYHSATGWKERGGGWASSVSDKGWAGLEAGLARAESDLLRALALHPSFMAAHYQLLLDEKARGSGEAPGGALRGFAWALRRLLFHEAAGARSSRRAEEVLADALRVCPDCYRVRRAHMLGLLPRWGGSHDAMRAFAEQSRAASANPRLRLLAGYADWDVCDTLTDDGDLEAALQACDRAASVGENPDFLEQKANVLYKLDRLEEASALFDQILRLRPQDDEALAWQARVLLKLERWEQAQANLALAWQLAPDDTTVVKRLSRGQSILTERGHRALRERRYEEAIHDYGLALRFNTNAVEALYWRGSAFSRQGRLDEALADLYEARRIDPENSDVAGAIEFVERKRRAGNATPEDPTPN